MKKREAKSKREKERYTHLNAEFQRISRRDKKAFLSDQCKEIEENNRMGKTRGYANDTTLMAESEELKRILMKVKEESEKVGLKLNIQKTNIMASGPITSWEIDGETVETVTDFIFLGSKSLQMVTAAIKSKDAPWKKSYDQPRWHLKKTRHYFANKGPSSQN